MPITVDLKQIEALAADLDNAYKTINETAAEAVNQTAKAVRQSSVKEVVSQVNLTESYTDPKVELKEQARPTTLSATIEVRDVPIFLSTYYAQQKTVSNVWTEAMYAAKFGSLEAKIKPSPNAPAMPWTKRRGDKLRNIAAGSKAAGITASIKIGSNAEMRHTFLMPVRSGATMQGRWGTFAHWGKGQNAIRGMYGPSVYQVVKGVWRDGETQYTDLLSDAVLTAVGDEVSKALRIPAL